MVKKNILLIGGGGHCKSCIEVIETLDEYNIFGIIDLEENLNKTILGYKVIGTDKDIIKFKNDCEYALLTIGLIKNNDSRKNLFENIKMMGFIMPTILSKFAYVSKHSFIDEGTIIMNHALVNAGAKIGKNCIINNKSLIEHDVIIGNNTHISTNAIINGDVVVGNDCLIGSGSVVNQGLKISDNCIIGSNSTVLGDLLLSGVYVGQKIKQ